MDNFVLDKFLPGVVIFFMCLIILAIGIAVGETNTVDYIEDDCIVYNSKLYCEVSNIGRGE